MIQLITKLVGFNDTYSGYFYAKLIHFSQTVVLL